MGGPPEPREAWSEGKLHDPPIQLLCRSKFDGRLKAGHGGL